MTKDASSLSNQAIAGATSSARPGRRIGTLGASRFGEQVEDYACVYTGRVSNFLAYSPLRYFRSPRDHMPHELV